MRSWNLLHFLQKAVPLLLLPLHVRGCFDSSHGVEEEEKEGNRNLGLSRVGHVPYRPPLSLLATRVPRMGEGNHSLPRDFVV